MRVVRLLILIAQLLWLWGCDMQFKLPLQSVHFDAAGIAVVHDQPYIVEWLRRNYAINGGFEDWTLTDPTNWTAYYFSKDIVNFRSGAIGAKSDAGAVTANLISDYIAMRPGVGYRVSGYFKSSSGALTDVADVGLYFFDSSYNLVKDVSVSLNDVSASSWTLVSKLYTLGSYPGTAAYVKIVVTVILGAGQPAVYCDDVCLSVHNPLSVKNYSDFAVLNSGDLETFTFPDSAPLVQTELASQDDPTTAMESESGNVRIESSRCPRRELVIRIRLYSREALQQLRRFHAKVRNISFVYVDENSIEYDVIWRGPFNPPAINPQDVYVIDIPLKFLTITPGE